LPGSLHPWVIIKKQTLSFSHQERLMTARILVAYASRKGSTAEIAQAVGRELQSTGYEVVVKEMIAVTALDGYDAIVLGAPVYMRKIIEIGSFVKRFREKLGARPVAAFAVGMAPVSKNPLDVEDETKLLLDSISPVVPVAAAVFAGRVDPEKLNFIMRRMLKAAKSPVGDFRDWDAISAWAGEISARFGV
jgi:menaquinone-dependent protoporphyrinogen oxidase